MEKVQSSSHTPQVQLTGMNQGAWGNHYIHVPQVPHSPIVGCLLYDFHSSENRKLDVLHHMPIKCQLSISHMASSEHYLQHVE